MRFKRIIGLSQKLKHQAMDAPALLLATARAVPVETAGMHTEQTECGEQGSARAARIWLRN